MNIEETIINAVNQSVMTAIQPLMGENIYLRKEISNLRREITNLLKVSDPDERLTVSQVAKELKKTEQTVRMWCRDGKIDCEIKGRSYLIRRSSLDKPLNFI